MDVVAADLPELMYAAVASHRRMLGSASRMTDEQYSRQSLLAGWSRGHVLAHWARNADGQTRMLLAAIRGELVAQYPGGSAQRQADIEASAALPARLVLEDVRAAVERVEDVWRHMPPDAWPRPTDAHVGTRPAWMSVWARWRETEIHHVDLDVGYTHRDWPPEFVDVMLPRVLPTLDDRLTGEVTVQVRVTDRHLVSPHAAATTADDVIVRGSASALLCWLVGRPIPAAAGLTVRRSGQAWPLPRLRPWA